MKRLPPKDTNRKMNGSEKKFEEARKRFRRNMEREAAKQRRTIFLDDDDIPSCSHRRPRQRRERPSHRPARPDTAVPHTTPGPRREEVRLHFMSTPPRSRSPRKDPQSPSVVIEIDSDSDMAPTPHGGYQKIWHLHPHGGYPKRIQSRPLAPSMAGRGWTLL